MMDAAHSFGRWLNERRRALDFTQHEPARQVGCAVITIKKFEAGERRPSRQIAARLLDVLALPPEERTAFFRLARTPPHPSMSSAAPAPPTAAVSEHVTVDDSGRAVRGYELRERLGAGGFGAV